MKAVALILAFVTGVACVTDGEGKREEASVSKKIRRRPGTGPGGAGLADGMKVDNELGVVDVADVEAVLQDNFGRITGCYNRAGKAQKYAQGQVLLRFVLAGDGRTDDVLVVESDLGNYEVERCLVEVGRKLVFRAPEGRKSTTFDYPVEFRPSGHMAVLDIDGLKIDRDLATLAPQLSICGPLGKDPVAAIMYIEPNGSVGSVGLTSSSTLDEDVGDCVVQTMRGWHLTTTLPGRVLRCNFVVPNVAVATDGPRRSSLRVVARRRTR